MPLLNTAVMATFATRNRSKSPCPLIDILAYNGYFRSARFKPSRREGKADSSSFAIICLSIVPTVSIIGHNVLSDTESSRPPNESAHV